MKKITPLLLSTALLISPSLFASGAPERNHSTLSPQVKITVDAFLKAAGQGDFEIIKKYLEQGGDVDAKRGTGAQSRTALDIAVSAPNLNPKIITYLLDHKANPNTLNFGQLTPLSTAVSKGYTDIISLLLRHGANINEQFGKPKTTILHTAIRSIIIHKGDSLELLQLLIKEGAEMNARDAKGETPLHFASRIGKLNVVKLLCDSGADPFIENQDKKLPVDLTTSSEVKEYLNRLPKPLIRQSLERVRKMIQEGKMTQEEAKQKLPTELWSQL